MQALRIRAEADAEELLRDARAHARRMVEEMQTNLEEHQHRVENFFDDARSKLGSLVRDLFDQIGSVSAAQEESHVRTDQRLEQYAPCGHRFGDSYRWRGAVLNHLSRG